MKAKIIGFLLFCFLSLQTQAQVVKVIDHKGTIFEVNNNQVTTSTTAPTNPLSNDVWFDTTTNITKIWDGTAWKEIDPDKVTTAATAPTTPVEGDVWFDTTLNYSKIWDGSTWKANNTWLGYKTIHHNATSVLAITHADHNNADIHVENTGDLSLTNTDVTDATNFYITNTTAADRTLSFTGFTGAYLRNGGTIADVATGGLTLKANTRYLCHITDNNGTFYFNATEAASGGGGGGSSIADADGDTYIEVEETADEDHIHMSTSGVERIRVGNTGLVEFGPMNTTITDSLTPPTTTFQRIASVDSNSAFEWTKFIFGTTFLTLSLPNRTYDIPFTNTTTKGIVEGSTATTVIGSIQSDYWIYVVENIYLKVIKVQFQLSGNELQVRALDAKYRNANQVAVADQNGTFFETGAWTTYSYVSQEIAVTYNTMIPATINTSNGESYFLGNVGIGTSSPDQKLSVNGEASKVGGGSWATFSDRRVKDNIRDYSEGLDKLKQVRPVRFNYTANSGYSELTKDYVGVIAQEIEQILPGTVTTFDDSQGPSGLPDKRQFNPSELVWTSINAIKELAAEIETLQRTNQELETDNKALLKRIQNLESLLARIEALEKAVQKD